jgi:hypothetical protein
MTTFFSEEGLMNRRTLITTVLLLVGMTFGFGLGWYAHDLSNARQTLEQQSLLMLKHRFRNGMSLSEVSRVVGEGMLQRRYAIPDSISEHMIRMFRSRVSGYQEDDEFCAIRLGLSTVTLQFRNESLINCIPELDFAAPEDTVQGIAG